MSIVFFCFLISEMLGNVFLPNFLFSTGFAVFSYFPRVLYVVDQWFLTFFIS